MSPNVAQNKSVVIANVEIPFDENGLYSLNALHRASEAWGNRLKAPNRWLENKTTQELITELREQVRNSGFGETDVVSIVHGGSNPGTYAHELLAVSYAGWISARFQLIVNQAFIDSKTRNHPLPQVINPALQALIDVVVRQDKLEQELLALQERDRQRDKMLIAQQSEIIRSLQQSQRAEEKASMALDDAHLMTIEEFIVGQKLVHQFPPNTWAQAGKWLSKFCSEWNLRSMPKPTPWKQWQSEQAYPTQALSAWLRDQIRKGGQTSIEDIEDDGVWYRDRESI